MVCQMPGNEFLLCIFATYWPPITDWFSIDWIVYWQTIFGRYEIPSSYCFGCFPFVEDVRTIPRHVFPPISVSSSRITFFAFKSQRRRAANRGIEISYGCKHESWYRQLDRYLWRWNSIIWTENDCRDWFYGVCICYRCSRPAVADRRDRRVVWREYFGFKAYCRWTIAIEITHSPS